MLVVLVPNQVGRKLGCAWLVVSRVMMDTNSMNCTPNGTSDVTAVMKSSQKISNVSSSQ